MNEYGRHWLPEYDRLGFQSTINAVADAIWHHKDGRFNVGVFGKWGSGKSGFLHLLEKRLKVEHNSKFAFVHFSAWRFRKPADAAIALVNAMMADLPQRAAKKLLDFLNKYGIPATVGLVNIVFKGTGSVIAKALKQQEELQTKARHGGLLEERYFLHKAVKETFDALPKPVVVLVDDLDRCLYKETVDILESIKTVFDVPKCIFVVAADHARVQKAIGKVRSKPEAHRYLDKIINLPVNVPSIKKDVRLLDGFLRDQIRLGWLQNEGDDGNGTSSAEQNILTDLFLRGVRSNPRDMALAAEKFELLQRIVKKDPRINQIIDQSLLLKIALLQNLLGERFRDLEEKPGRLREWELGINRPDDDLDDDDQKLLGEIMRPILSAEGGGSFSELEDTDLRLYSSLAAHDAERAIESLKAGMLDVSDRIATIRQQLEKIDLTREECTPEEAVHFERIIDPYRRAMRVRYDQPPEIQALFAAVIELARSDGEFRKRIKKFLDFVSDQYANELSLIRWEIVTQVTTLYEETAEPSQLINFVTQRARGMVIKEDLIFLRSSLFDSAVKVNVNVAGGAGSVRISKLPVSNDQYEKFDPGHVVLRHNEVIEGDDSVSIVNLIDAALFCEWLNTERAGAEGYWACLPTIDEWREAVRVLIDRDMDPDELRIARNVWEWTVSPLDDDPVYADVRFHDVLALRGFPHVWVCGGSWYQQEPQVLREMGMKREGELSPADKIKLKKAKKQAFAEAQTQQLWFPPTNQRADVGFRVFWYKKDRYASQREEVKLLEVARKEVKLF